MEWDTEAKSFLDGILAEMPFFVRTQARSATAERAEELATDRGADRISKDDMITAIVLITPDAMREPLKAMLVKRGIDLARFEEHFQ